METLARRKGLRIEQLGMGTGSVHGTGKQPICYSEPYVHWLGNECTMSRLAAAALCSECRRILHVAEILVREHDSNCCFSKRQTPRQSQYQGHSR